MTGAKVVHFKVREDKGKEGVLESVAKVMEEALYRLYVKGTVFLKVNLLSEQVVPGCCTSPWVLEGVVRKMKEDGFKEIYVGDANVATSKQVERAAKKWGVMEICEKYGAKFVNLSKARKRKIKSHVFGIVEVPDILKRVDSVVSVPVLKTHNVAGFTCCLKNLWGCLPEVRHRYHLMLDKCIPEINRIVKADFAVVDATVCTEGSGPRTGKPKIVGSVFAGGDLVAIDSLCSEMIGVNDAGYVKKAAESGLGSIYYEVTGDEIKRVKFEPGIAVNHPIVFMELILRRIPVLKWFLFETSFFRIPAFFASKYNSFVWYNLKGKKYARALVKKSRIYGEEFGGRI